MKQFSILIFAFVLAALSLQAAKPYLQGVNDINNYSKMIQAATVEETPVMKKISTPSMLLNYNAIEGSYNVFGNYVHYGHINPIVYEPVSGSLIISNNAYLQGDTQNDPLKGQTGVLYTTNMGNTWNTKILLEESGKLPLLHSLGVVNYDESSSPENFAYYSFGPYWQHTSGTSYNVEDGKYLVVTPQHTEHFELAQPINNNDGYPWWTATVTGTNGMGFPLFFQGNMLSSVEGLPYGIYGISSLYVIPENDEVDFAYSGIPEQLELDNFRPSTQDGSYNNIAHVGADKSGNLYFCANNMFADDVNNRVPGVIKSTDMGETWSDWNKMPAGIIEDYFLAQGALLEEDHGFYAYRPNDFIVYAEDNYSYFGRLTYIFPRNDTLFRSIFIAECNYNGSEWSLIPVAELMTNNLWAIMDRGTGGIAKDSLYSSLRANEVEAAVTADGSAVLVKWVDLNDNIVEIDPPVTVVATGGSDPNYTEITVEFDTVFTTDIFYSYRKLNETNFSEVVNITGDELYNNFTFLPNVIPSLNDVMMMTYITIKPDDPLDPRNSYPETTITQWLIDERSQMAFLHFDAENPANSVEERRISLSTGDMYPNPAAENITIPLDVKKDGSVTVEIFTTLGEKIATVHNGMLSAGHQVLPFSVRDLNSGVYICKVSMNGGVTSELFTVQR